VKGRWAQGLEPRYFVWVIKERLAASERPGGYARNHRKVRREEEILWLRQQGFTRVLSLLESPHNLKAYDDMGLPCDHVPLGRAGTYSHRLPDVYEAVAALAESPTQRVLVHHEEFGDVLAGVIAGYLLYQGLVTHGPHAITLVERLVGRQMGPPGRQVVAVTIEDGIRRAPAARRPTLPSLDLSEVV
jgi:hypothetical protein